MRKRVVKTAIGETLERRDLLTVDFDFGLTAEWVQQLDQFADQSLQQIAAECNANDDCARLSRVQTYDGVGNNQDQPLQGATHQPLRRNTTIAYGDGMASPAGADRPNPREISNLLAKQQSPALSAQQLSNMVWIWGQFIDHDVTLTPSNPDEPFAVVIPAGDPNFDPSGSGEMTLPFNRSTALAGSGESVDNPRIQMNNITAYLDGSAVYGSDPVRANALRQFEGGRLKLSDGEMLPLNTAGLPNDGGSSPEMFLAGDVRANENVALTAMHTIWVREHNQIADQLRAESPEWNDEQIFQYTRAIVASEIQAITFNEFLPALLGPSAVATYGGYDPTVDPTISSLFAGATYRFGHSMLPEHLMRMDGQHQTMADGPMPLRNAFFAPHSVDSGTVGSVLQGASYQLARNIDNQMVDAVRNFMFGDPGRGGFDLAALNIQRGRDQGLASYNQVRRDLGLEPVTQFSEITADAAVVAKLESLYSSVEDIDVWVGALAEDPMPAAAVGEVAYHSIRNQFTQIRDGDRFWYENRFDGMLRQQLRRTTLRDVIERNSTAANLQDNVFIATQTAPDVGDVNGDARIDQTDLLELTRAIKDGLTDARFDVDQDGIVHSSDARYLAISIMNLIPGDANADGLFDSEDLIQVFQAGEYEDDLSGNSTWSDGDFDGDGDFTTTDMIIALQTGKYDNSRPFMARSTSQLPSPSLSAPTFAAQRRLAAAAVDMAFGDDSQLNHRRAAAATIDRLASV